MGTRTEQVGMLSGLGAAALLLLFTAQGAAAQEADADSRVVPTNAFVVSGYGTVGYSARTTGENINAFTAGINPIFLFQFQDRVLFEAEFEFELEEGITETGLEYAQLDFVATDNLTLVGGKFLLPFGVFGERLHPTWINKFPSAPPLYGHHVSDFGAEPLLPILSDLGLMARGTVSPGAWQLSLNPYVVQGPVVEGELEGEETHEGEIAVPELEFPASSSDNNANKMPGVRLDIALPPWLEVNGSILNGDYDEVGILDFTAWNLAAELRFSKFELRGEYVQTRQEIETLEGFPTLVRDGFYAQASYRAGRWEPVFRWTQVFDDQLAGESIGNGAWQAGFGLDYWFSPSIAVMAGYELNREDGAEVENDRFLIHVAFGY
ncbi:MAG: hypothetical protein ACE5JR_09770 [Gemmatimonadota bacterium]